MASMIRSLLALFVFAALWGSASAATAESAPRVSSAADLKAVFLFRFSQFVTWPAATFPNEEAPFVIGICGSEPIAATLEQIVRGERASGHPIDVRRVRSIADVRQCHIVYFEAGSAEADLVRGIRDQPVLTVGESKAFREAGGIIQFVLDDNRLRMRINAAPAKSVGLVISTKLLRIAEKVEGAAK
jgi:hypothetical protein